MYSRILTPLERRRAESYLEDGESTPSIQVLVSRARSYLPQIKSDLAIIEKLVEAYERSRVWQRWKGRVVKQWLEGAGITSSVHLVDGKYLWGYTFSPTGNSIASFDSNFQSSKLH